MKTIIMIVTLFACLAVANETSLAQNWAPLTPSAATAPAPRSNAAAIYDSVNHRLVIFGGKSASGNLNDVWAFDLKSNSWSELTPASGPAPAPRFTASGVYNPAKQQMIIWSGQGASFFNDVWAFDLNTKTWSPFAPPDPKPNIRYGAASIFDPKAKDLVTFAGFTDVGRFDDTWRFNVDNANWTELSLATHPEKRCLHAASYDALKHRMIIYGGQNNGPRGDIWAFDLAKNIWTDLTPQNSPAGRWFPTNIYAAASHRVIIFGGNLGSGQTTNDVLAFDLAQNSWQSLSVSGTPPAAREGAVAIYILAEDRMVVFGGLGDAYFNDVWSLNNLSPVLPVELASFRADAFDHNITLSWSTQSETNNYGFEVQRSVDEQNFIKAGFISGQGTITASQQYSFTEKNLPSGSYWYRLKQIDFDGSFVYSGIVTVRIELPKDFRLLGNYPNPFNPQTTIEYEVPEPSHVSIRIYNLQGQQIKNLLDAKIDAGRHQIVWDGTNDWGTKVTSGIYFYVLKADAISISRKMALVE